MLQHGISASRRRIPAMLILSPLIVLRRQRIRSRSSAKKRRCRERLRWGIIKPSRSYMWIVGTETPSTSAASPIVYRLSDAFDWIENVQNNSLWRACFPSLKIIWRSLSDLTKDEIAHHSHQKVTNIMQTKASHWRGLGVLNSGSLLTSCQDKAAAQVIS